MTNYYAQIDNERIVIALTQAAGPIDGPEMIEIVVYDETLIGKRHNAQTGEFEPVPVPPAEPDPRLWWMDVGPFYDRFGADAIAIAASDNGACKAVQTLTGVRKYVDLKDPRIGQMIDMLIATAQPAAQPWAPGSGPMTLEKKAAILTTPTTEYERHVKGLIESGA